MLHCILHKALFVRLHEGLLVLSFPFNKKLGFYILYSKAADSVLSGLSFWLTPLLLSAFKLLLCVMVITCGLGDSVESHSSFCSPFASTSCSLGSLITGVHL